MQERRFGNDNRFGRLPPVKVGDELDLTIEAIGEKGDGVAKKDGFVLFIPDVKEGEHVRAKITRVLRKVGFAEVSERLEGSAQQAPKQQPKEAEEELSPDESKDSEDFGDEPKEDFGGEEEKVGADDSDEELPEPEAMEEDSEEKTELA
jgi:predicted RNA-binding protein with TRAM domain